MITPYLDASAIIYLIEGSPALRARVAAHIAITEQASTGRLFASQLSRLECRVKPLRAGDAALLTVYDAFFTRARLDVLEVSTAIVDRATELRARHGFKVPDAIHLASALEAGADAFLTGDAALTKCPNLNVVLLGASPP